MLVYVQVMKSEGGKRCLAVSEESLRSSKILPRDLYMNTSVHTSDGQDLFSKQLARVHTGERMYVLYIYTYVYALYATYAHSNSAG